MKNTMHVFIAVFLLMIIMCSCTKEIVVNSTNELTMHKWTFTGEYGMEGILQFSDDKASFCVYEDGKLTSKIYGYYSINSECFTIYDVKLPENIVFYYKLNGNTAEITYSDASILMKKTDI